MMHFTSRHLSAMQLHSLQRLGDMYIPGNGVLPSFSQTGCLQHVDVVLDKVDPDDVFLMGILLHVLRWMPAFMIEFLLTQIDRHHQYPEFIAGPMRLMSLALKGITMSLYYSGLGDLPEDAVSGGSGVHQKTHPGHAWSSGPRGRGRGAGRSHRSARGGAAPGR